MEVLERKRVLVEGVDPDDAILQFPVSIMGKDKKSDGVPYHLTIRWGKNNDPEKLVQDVTDALKGLDLSPPQVSHLSPQIFHGKDASKTFYVLVSPHVPQSVLDIKHAVDPIFGDDPFDVYKLHVTVDQDLWDKVKKEYLSPGDLRLHVGPLELLRGNKVLKTFGDKVEEESRVYCESFDFFGIPIHG